MHGLSLIYQVLLVITCHFKLEKAYGIAIHTKNFTRKEIVKESVVSHIVRDHILSGTVHEEQITK